MRLLASNRAAFYLPLRLRFAWESRLGLTPPELYPYIKVAICTSPLRLSNPSFIGPVSVEPTPVYPYPLYPPPKNLPSSPIPIDQYCSFPLLDPIEIFFSLVLNLALTSIGLVFSAK